MGRFKNTVEAFYTKYEKESEGFKRFIDSLGHDCQYYLLVKDRDDGKFKDNPILSSALCLSAEIPLI